MLDQKIDLTVFDNAGKYNTSIKLTTSDQKNKTKVYCKESYAQTAYDLLINFEKTGRAITNKKDLSEGDVCKVKAKIISYDDKMIFAESLDSGATIGIPFREYSKDIDLLVSDESAHEFLVTVYKVTEYGEFLGSEKKAVSITYRKELFDHLSQNTWFDVKIVKLIKGGYLAIYKKEVECFIPGSHAAANVVHNFNDLLGKTITVMIDNYDQSNDLFILSYKKYVAASMPLLISELQFDQEYVGVLTHSPYDFGIFVELNSYYTGMIHKSEFEDYESIRKKLKTGDSINVYIKDVISKNGQYRIVLTLNKETVNNEKLEWQSLRNKTENQSFRYSVDKNKNAISIDIDGESFEVSLRRKDLEKNLSRFPFVKVFKVDPINKRLRFEFVEEQ